MKMKINFYPNIAGLLSKVTAKGSTAPSNDKEGGAGQNAFERQQKKDSEQKKFEEVVNDETVQNAIEAFASDELNKTSGIVAVAEGTGPGLKVVLKDGSGGLLRSVSGEEFLKLHEAAVQGNRSGRLLDRKV
jgi:hypothetical protein